MEMIYARDERFGREILMLLNYLVIVIRNLFKRFSVNCGFRSLISCNDNKIVIL